jgi:hypothetical protein
VRTAGVQRAMAQVLRNAKSSRTGATLVLHRRSAAAAGQPIHARRVSAYPASHEYIQRTIQDHL